MERLIGTAVAVLLAPVLLLSAAAAGFFGADSTSEQADASSNALADIPTALLVVYQRAATAECDGLPWTVLAAIGKVESDHGRSTAPGVHSGANTAGAQGPMQFLPATFAAYDQPVPPGGADPPSPYDAVDAIHAAARYLCATGARESQDLPGAVWHYNHDDTYVTRVLDIARGYVAAATPTNASAAATTAVAFATAQLGVPYVWGGDGPAEGGFDCSGLTRAAYATAGITIPRTADQQWHAGPSVAAGQPLALGDLLFYGTPAKATHVTLYIGAGRVIHAPEPGKDVQYASIWFTQFLGATRPSQST